MPKTNLPTDSAMRKEMPIQTGVIDYFPDAIAFVARLSVLGNEKHNPGEPLHWARGKSMDQPDCMARHNTERGTIDSDDGVLHDIKLAWRALANAQIVIEERIAAGLPLWDEDVIAANRSKQKAKLAAIDNVADKIAAKVVMPDSAILGLDEPATATNAIKR